MKIEADTIDATKGRVESWAEGLTPVEKFAGALRRWRNKTRRARATLGAIVLTLTPAPNIAAQTANTASISGRVADSAGAAVSGSAVTLRRLADRSEMRATADAAGEFRFTGLAAGEYQITIFSPRFAAFAQAVKLASGETRQMDFTLRPAAVSEDIVISATRAPSTLSTIPASVTLLEPKVIEQQAAIARNLTEILGKTVPGLGLSRETEAIFGQNLRGRDMLVLIDGVPQNFDLRIGATDELARIDPSRVERIEVVRGASALYGSAAAGGIISVITKGPAERLDLTTELGTAFSATHPSDSFTKRIAQTVTGNFKKSDYLLVGSFADTDSDFDAEGDRIPQLFLGPHSEQLDLSGKLGFIPGANQRLQFNAGSHRAKMDKFFGPTGGVFGVRKAQAVELPLGTFSPEDNPQFPPLPPYKRQHTLRLDYAHGDLKGSQLRASLFYLDYFRRNVLDDFFGGQLLPDFEKTGFRLDVETPLKKALPSGGAVAWGFDFTDYNHAEPFSNGTSLVAPIDQQNYAGFAQFSAPIRSRVTLRGGLRHEQFRTHVNDFNTHPGFGGNFVRGGDLKYGATTFNIGGVFKTSKNLDVFSSFAQGFSITEIGRLLSRTNLPSVALARPKPQKVDNYEFGLRGALRGLGFTISGFHSRSELGTTFFINPATGIPEIIRSPERINGVEATADARIGKAWRLGGSFSWQRGEHDPEQDGTFTPLPGFRIAPPKLTAYVERSIGRRWRNLAQVTYSGSRDLFPGSTGFGEGPVRSVFLMDLLTTFDLPRGRLTIGVANLLNRFYFPPANQAFNSDFLYVAGRGATVSVGYSIRWKD